MLGLCLTRNGSLSSSRNRERFSLAFVRVLLSWLNFSASVMSLLKFCASGFVVLVYKEIHKGGVWQKVMYLAELF